jgi:hypothetical protein
MAKGHSRSFHFQAVIWLASPKRGTCNSFVLGPLAGIADTCGVIQVLWYATTIISCAALSHVGWKPFTTYFKLSWRCYRAAEEVLRRMEALLMDPE